MRLASSNGDDNTHSAGYGCLVVPETPAPIGRANRTAVAEAKSVPDRFAERSADNPPMSPIARVLGIFLPRSLKGISHQL